MHPILDLVEERKVYLNYCQQVPFLRNFA